MPVFLVGSLLALLASTGCSSERSSPECKDTCHKQARCVDVKAEAPAVLPAGEQNKFDQSECIAACSALQRDREGKKLVAQHIDCVNRAENDCATILACP